MHRNICRCSGFIQYPWAAVQKNNVSCWTVKCRVCVEGWCFSPATALNKLLKRPRRAAAGIWRATETALWSRVRVWLWFRERNLMTLGQRDVWLHFISSLLPKRVHSGEREGWIIKAAWLWGFILEEFFLPVGIFWCSIFFPWTSWQVLHCAGPVPGSVVAELACVWIPEEGVTKRTSDFALYAFLEPHFLLRVSAPLSCIEPLIIHATQTH